MATLNITLDGLSADVPLEAGERLSDAEVKRIALEVVRSGRADGLRVNVPDDVFAYFVVDRFTSVAGGSRLYLRPKVPFGLKGAPRGGSGNRVDGWPAND